MCAFWTLVGATARLGVSLGWAHDDGFYPVPVPLTLFAAWSFLMLFVFGAFFSPVATTSACDKLLVAVRAETPRISLMAFLTHVRGRLLSCAAMPVATRRDSCVVTCSHTVLQSIPRYPSRHTDVGLHRRHRPTYG